MRHVSKTGAIAMSILLLMGIMAYAGAVSALSLTGNTGLDIGANGNAQATQTNTQVSGVGSADVGARADANAGADFDGRGRALRGDADAEADAEVEADSEGSANLGVSIMAAIDGAGRAVAKTARQISADIRERQEAEASFTSSEAIEARAREIDSSFRGDADFHASGFARVMHGSGWAVSSEEGAFARILIVEKTFVDSSSDEEVTEARGTIKLNSRSAYNLDLTSRTDENMTFDVMSNGRTVGTLELEEKSSFGTFTVWEGKLDLDSEEEQEISIATTESRMRGSAEAQAEADAEADGRADAGQNETSARGNGNAEARGGLWMKIRGFFGLG